MASTSEAYPGSTQTPGYDDFGRMNSLAAISNNTPSTMFWTYDRYGNRLSAQAISSTTSFAFDAATNHLTNAQYDAAGNMTTGPDGTTYTYDADGNVISSITTTTNPITTQNQYDALNQRVKQTVSSTVTIFSFNPAGQRVAVYDGSMNLQRQQIYLDSKPVAFLTGAGNVYYQYLSGNGSKRIENDFDSNVGNVFNWSTWGDNLATYYGSDMDQYHYAMLDEDPDGTQHATFRNYNPNTAQWLSPDPYNGSYSAGRPQSFNRYLYASNNPLVYVDPNGLDDGLDIFPVPGNYFCVVYPSLCSSGGGNLSQGGDPYQGNAESGGAFGQENGTFGGGFTLTALDNGGGGDAPSKGPASHVCTPVFCPANDSPSTAKQDACNAQADAAEAKSANPTVTATDAGKGALGGILSNARGATWINAIHDTLVGLYMGFMIDKSVHDGIGSMVYRDCMSKP